MKLKIVLFTLFLTTLNFAQTGLLAGKVTDASTKEALIGVNILVTELENIGAATDIDGNFKIKIPVGSYSIKVSLIGYTTNIRTDIVIKTNSDL